jgi:hypothetical protein
MDIDFFFAQHKIRAEDICAAIKAHVGLESCEPLYLSGSLAEGLGNGTSDIDVFLVTDRRIQAESFGDAILIPFSPCSIDLEVLSLTALRDLIARLQAFPAEEERDVRSSMGFSPRDLTLLHRLLIGRPLAAIDTFEELRSALAIQSLARLLFDQAAGLINSLALDIEGLLSEPDLDSAVVLAQRVLGATIDAILAVQGSTNPNQKWRFRRLRDQERAGFRYSLPPELTSASSYEALRALYLLEGVTPEGYAAYTHRCLALARHILPWGQRIFVGAAHVPWLQVAFPTDHRQHVESSVGLNLVSTSSLTPDVLIARLPTVAPSTCVSWRDNKLVLYRMGDTLEVGISDLMLTALYYFDGYTTLAEATAHLSCYTPAPAVQVARTFLDLQAFLGLYGFLSDKVEARPDSWQDEI